MNAGQICLAPDYVLAPKEKVRRLRDGRAPARWRRCFRPSRTIADYTAIINQRHYDRVRGLIDDASAKGAEVVEINPANEDFSQQEHRKIPPTLILDATDDMNVMQEEIFGPVLPVKTYARSTRPSPMINAPAAAAGALLFRRGRRRERSAARRARIQAASPSMT